MINYIDLIFVAMAALVVFISVKSGFFKTLFDLVAYVFAVTAAKTLSPVLAEGAFDSFIRKGAEEYLSATLANIENADYSAQAESIVDSLPSGLRGILEIVGLGQEEITQQLNSVELNSENIISTLMDKIVEPVGVAVMQFVLFVILAIVLLIVAKIVVRLLNGIVKRLPVIRKFNSLFGGVLGLVKAVVLAVALSALLSLIASVSDNQAFIEAVSESAVVNALTAFIGDFSF